MLDKITKNNFVCYTVIILSLFLIPYTLGKYSSTLSKRLIITAVQPEYTVAFVANNPTGSTVSGSMSPQNFVYGTVQNLNTNNYVVNGYQFAGWNTSADGTGNFYSDGDSVGNLTSIDGAQITLYGQWSDVVAEVNGVTYTTLQAAFNAVPNNTETVVTVLCNISTSSVTVDNKKNIILDLQNFTLSSDGGNRIIDNKGRLTISNGTIRSSAAYAALDNEQSGTLIITGGNIIATGERQAIYNNKGTVQISGNPYMSSSAPERSTVHSLAGGNLTITGGTFISTTQSAISNAGTMTIGVKDGDVDTTSPVFQGATYGIESTSNFNFYNGIAKGKILPFNDETKITDKETGYNITHGVEIIGNDNYATGYLGVPVIVTFNGNGGTSSEATRPVEVGSAIGPLPTATRAGYDFVGWFTDPGQSGVQIDTTTIITGAITYYAHWKESYAAEVNGVEYSTLQAAINTVTANSPSVTITLLKDITENVTIGTNKNIIFDFQNYTIRNSSHLSVITNEGGNVTISNGTIMTDSQNASAINNNGGTLNVTGGNVYATGKRQAIYNDGGTVNISGTAYLHSVSTQRATVQNLAGSTLNITGGTIISTNQQAVNNLATMTIGVADGTSDSTTPILQGATYGITSTTSYNFYDGIAKGKTAAVDNEGRIMNIESGYAIAHGTETIEGNLYQTLYLN